MISPALFLFNPLILQLFVITGLVPVIYDYDAYEWIAGIHLFSAHPQLGWGSS